MHPVLFILGTTVLIYFCTSGLGLIFLSLFFSSRHWFYKHTFFQLFLIGNTALFAAYSIIYLFIQNQVFTSILGGLSIILILPALLLIRFTWEKKQIEELELWDQKSQAKEKQRIAVTGFVTEVTGKSMKIRLAESSYRFHIKRYHSLKNEHIPDLGFHVGDRVSAFLTCPSNVTDVFQHKIFRAYVHHAALKEFKDLYIFYISHLFWRLTWFSLILCLSSSYTIYHLYEAPKLW